MSQVVVAIFLVASPLHVSDRITDEQQSATGSERGPSVVVPRDSRRGRLGVGDRAHSHEGQTQKAYRVPATVFVH